jgi:hypothetical protein
MALYTEHLDNIGRLTYSLKAMRVQQADYVTFFVVSAFRVEVWRCVFYKHMCVRVLLYSTNTCVCVCYCFLQAHVCMSAAVFYKQMCA